MKRKYSFCYLAGVNANVRQNIVTTEQIAVLADNKWLYTVELSKQQKLSKITKWLLFYMFVSSQFGCSLTLNTFILDMNFIVIENFIIHI